MRKLCTFALPCCAAMLLSSLLSAQALLLPAAFLCALAGLAAHLLRRRKPSDLLLRLCLVLLGLSLGFLRSWSHEAFVLSPARALDGQTLPISARLDDYPAQGTYSLSLSVTLTAPDGTSAPAILYVSDPDGTLTLLEPGDRVTCRAALRYAGRVGGRESFYYLSGGTLLLASARGEAEVLRADAPPLTAWPARVSHSLKASLQSLFPRETAGLLTALLLGDKATLEDGLYTAMKRSGVAHIAAVSGLHVSFLGALLALLFGARRRLGALLSIAVLLFFACAVGGSPSVLRAVYLHSALLLAPLLGREEDRATSLSAVLLLLLLVNPYASLNVGLQLSFASVSGILLVSQPLYGRWTARLPGAGEGPPVHRLLLLPLRGLLASLSVTAGALLFTTPLSACYFGSVSLLSPLSNLLILWAVPLAFLAGLLLSLLFPLLPAAALQLSPLAALPAEYVSQLARGLSRIPFASVPTSSPYVVFWLVFTYLLLLLPALRRGRMRLSPIFCSSLLCLLVCLGLHTISLRTPGLVTQVLDVGQGQSVLFLSRGRSALLDCGGAGSDDPGQVAADALCASGSGSLDLLILTHYHADHASGVPALLERLEVGALLLPDVEPDSPLRARILALAEEKGIPVTFVTDDLSLSLGAAQLRIFAPLGTGGGNEEGLSVLASRGEFDVLVTGDMNAQVELRLLKYGALPDIELLVAGHHGAGSSTSEAFLAALRPQWAVISCGYDNSYGHPAGETLSRLAQAGCAVYRTDLMGTVTVTSREGH